MKQSQNRRYITVEPDGFFTRSRVRLCRNTSCRHNRWRIGEVECNLKEIELDDAGRCTQAREVEHGTT
ncbi:MAG: hypothetical protein WC343_00045 [Bacilli bacterium]|jgi:hypothetical protein